MLARVANACLGRANLNISTKIQIMTGVGNLSVAGFPPAGICRITPSKEEKHTDLAGQDMCE